MSDADDALGGLAGSHDFAVIVMAAMRAHVMRALQLTAIAALGMALGAQSQMAAPHASTRRGGFTLGNSHNENALSQVTRNTERAR